MKILIDNCVIIDALQDRQPFSQYAKQIFLAVAQRYANACITAKSITDIYYLTHKQTHSDIKTRKILQELFSLFDVVDTLATDCLNAVSSPMNDYEDAVMSETAIRESVDYIVTRNERDYSKSKVPVVSPQAFIDLLR